MSIVTQKIARSVARKLSEGALLEYEKARYEFKTLIFKEYINTIPTEISKADKTNPEYFQHTSIIKVIGSGFNHDDVNTPDIVPVINNSGNYYCILSISEEASEKAQKLRSKYTKLEGRYKQLRENIYQSLISLRTYKRVEEYLPEAVQFLPEIKKLEITLNFGDLRKEISNYSNTK